MTQQCSNFRANLFAGRSAVTGAARLDGMLGLGVYVCFERIQVPEQR